MKSFGVDHSFSEKESQFFQRLESYGNAIFHMPPSSIPNDWSTFIYEQYGRFRINLEGKASDLCVISPSIVLDLFDYSDPYLLFYGHSDVLLTDDWRECTYEISEDGIRFWEADPELLETYSYIPGQSEAFFNEHINKPGLSQMPQYIASSLYELAKETLNDGYCTTHVNEDAPSEVYRDLIRICTLPDGSVNDEKLVAYIDLSLWAGLIWFLGHTGTPFRTSFSDVTECAVESGECILYDGEVISPKFYRKTNRPVYSCYKCGISAWCTTATIDDSGGTRFICEGCYSRGMVPRLGATCGTRFCKFFDCPHNSYYSRGGAAVREVMRTHGQLAQRAQQRELLLNTANQNIKQLGRGNGKAETNSCSKRSY